MIVTIRTVRAKTSARDCSEGPSEKRRDLEIIEIKLDRSWPLGGGGFVIESGPMSSKIVASHFLSVLNFSEKYMKLKIIRY